MANAHPLEEPLTADQLFFGPGTYEYFTQQMYFIIVLHCLYTQSAKV